MKVLFYTATCFLDTSLELIKILKDIVELHVIIEITPDTKNHNISEVGHLPKNKALVIPEEVFESEVLKRYIPYFNGVRSIHFAVHEKRGMLATLKVNSAVCRLIRKILPDVFHLEAMMFRTIGLVPALPWCKKLVMGIHDPIPHTGEHNWKIDLVRKMYFNFPISKVYLFYSKFACRQFVEHYKTNSSQLKILRLGPYSYYKYFKEKQASSREDILFFGRLSKYKGIDTLLKAIPLVLEKLPNVSFTIAGRSINGYTLDESTIFKYKKNINIINKHIENDELVSMIGRSKIVVCPYKDATQSGVLMTAWALDTPVIATNVGSFSEYIDDKTNSILIPVDDPAALAAAIVDVIDSGSYEQMIQDIQKMNDLNCWKGNAAQLLAAYS